AGLTSVGDMSTHQQVVFVAVVLLRLGVPLFIPRFPLPALLAALVIDGIDQTIFQWFDVTAVLKDYQNYDKALDIYYLVIAYTSTMRNWHHKRAFQVARGLWYYRLAGTLAFEFSGYGPLLLIFPNTFEYFVIAYEAVRTLWNPARLTNRQVVIGAAAIWIVVKLPQEWWIHVAHLDVTDEVAAHPLVAAVIFGAAALLIAAAGVFVWSRAPSPDWRFTVDVDAHQPHRRPDSRPEGGRNWLKHTGEKVVLTAAVVVIFGHILAANVGAGRLALGVNVVIVLNAGVTEALEFARPLPLPLAARFVVGVVVNAVIFEVLVLLRGPLVIDRPTALFLLLLLSLIVTFYDHFRAVSYGIAATAPTERSRASTPT
ncbi:MAG: hypothetical protein ABI345_00170, partial [Jatrophihabitans sp.]